MFPSLSPFLCMSRPWLLISPPLSPHDSLWYLNGNYLVIMVSASIILPLALMKQLGESITAGVI